MRRGLKSCDALIQRVRSLFYSVECTCCYTNEDLSLDLYADVGAKNLGRNLEDLCPVKNCKGRPVMPISYINEEGVARRTAVCEIHWDEFHNKRPKHLGPPFRLVFKDDIQIRNL